MSIYKASSPDEHPAQPIITSYRRTDRGAYFSVVFPGGMIINDLWEDTATGRPRVVTPFKTYQRHGGEVGYSRYVEFATHEAFREFQAEVLAALDRYKGASDATK